MSRAWVVQANPKFYDIDGALSALDRIWWRVPQYTAEIHTGDVVAVWRSGPEAGIVGVGRVSSEPQLRNIDPAEAPFVRSAKEDPGPTTRALLRLVPSPLVGKEHLRAVSDFAEHQILLAPMGTVFPLSDQQWEAIRTMLPSPPPPERPEDRDLPRTFSWAQRAKGVLPMPGGYSGYLTSLEQTCAVVAEERPTPAELARRLEEVLQVRATAARLRESFLRKIEIIVVQDGVCRLGSWIERWRQSRDDRIIAALLHGRCKFIGELLSAAAQPKTTDELLQIANQRYAMGWDTQTQIANRRGWLQSAGMLAPTSDGKIQTTAVGLGLLNHLDLYEPDRDSPRSAPQAPQTKAPEPQPVSTEAEKVEALARALQQTALDSTRPDGFERVVRDAFEFLGFRAEWLGGSGRTDVLVDATLGRDDTYRVILDCKTSTSGTVNDQQVDWDTLNEHRVKHDADYVALVGPSPSGRRLMERAAHHRVTIISVVQLEGLCRQHAKTPLGLADYRTLFAEGGPVETQALDERAEEVRRLMALAVAISDAVRRHTPTFGRLSARDLYLILASAPDAVAEATTEEELQDLLDTLASPLLDVLDGDHALGYRATTSPTTSAQRINILAEHLVAPSRSQPGPLAAP